MRIAMAITYRHAMRLCTRSGIAELVGGIIGKPFDADRIKQGVDGPGSILVTLPRDATIKQLVDVSCALDGHLPAAVVCRVEREE